MRRQADVDEKMLYDTFSAFGSIQDTPKIMRDPDTGNSKGFGASRRFRTNPFPSPVCVCGKNMVSRAGFVSYDSFEASDLAIECMHNQYLCTTRRVPSLLSARVWTKPKGPNNFVFAFRKRRTVWKGGPPFTFLFSRKG